MNMTQGVVMARGGFRPGSGPLKGTKEPNRMKRMKLENTLPPPDVARAAVDAGLTPLEYMLAVMRDPGADEVRRDRMAMAAAPYRHGRMSDNRVGKKDQARIDAATASEDSDLAYDGGGQLN